MSAKTVPIVARPRRRRHTSMLWLVHLPLLLLVVATLAPLFVLFVNSVKTDMDIKADPLGLPSSIQWGNFVAAWNTAGYTLAFRNSLIVSGATVLIVCITGGMCAHAMANLKLPGQNVVLVYLLLALTVPPLLYLVPLFYLWTKLHLINTLPGLILIYSALYLPFGIFLLRAYFINLPHEIEDAARIDGCSEWQTFVRVIVPLSWPAFTSVALIVAVWSWNEFIFAITFLPSQDVQTVAVRYATFTGQWVSNYAYISSAGVIMILPAVVLFLLLQRRFVEGMTAGGLKV
jgi:raffinose/stachyose/melibiose transport system permease protein